jgi:hypothetical protein
MAWGRRMTKLLKDGEGKWSVLKIVITAIITATTGTLISFSVSTAYGRYSWIRDQCYKVATNEKAIIQAGESLKAKDQWLEEEINKNNGVLHRRISGVEKEINQKVDKEQDKREDQDQRLLDLIIKVLESQQKQVEIQQKGLEKQEQFLMEQRTNGTIK